MKTALTLTQAIRRGLMRHDRLGEFMRKVRRFYYGSFRKDYVERSVSETRDGDCHRCGACCELLFQCPFLGRDGQNLPYCRIYGDLRPANCHSYPFDTVDAEIEGCGYTFKPEARRSDATLEKYRS